MFEEYNKTDTLKVIIDKYKNTTSDPLTFSEILGITTNLLETICLYENLWDKSYIIKERHGDEIDAETMFKQNICEIIKKSLENTVYSAEAQKNIIDKITLALLTYINSNCVY